MSLAYESMTEYIHASLYEPKILECEICGEWQKEEEVYSYGRHNFCSKSCLELFINQRGQ